MAFFLQQFSIIRQAGALESRRLSTYRTWYAFSLLHPHPRFGWEQSACIQSGIIFAVHSEGLITNPFGTQVYNGHQNSDEFGIKTRLVLVRSSTKGMCAARRIVDSLQFSSNT